jgi:hypothetical protein
MAFTTPAPVARARERRDATRGQDHNEEKGKDADAANVAACADSASTVGPFLDTTHEIGQRCRGITSMRLNGFCGQVANRKARVAIRAGPKVAAHHDADYPVPTDPVIERPQDRDGVAG